MALRNYQDESDFYTQGFEKEGYVSVWVGQNDDSGDPEELDVLQDLCGVGYYDLDNQESNHFDFKSSTIKKLIESISYSESFLSQTVSEASNKNIKEAKWVTVQFDFAYNPKKIKRQISNDPVFLGVFKYETND